MNKKTWISISLLFLALGLLLSGCSEMDEQKANQIVTEYLQAMEEQDWDPLQDLLTADFTYTTTDSNEIFNSETLDKENFISKMFIAFTSGNIYYDKVSMPERVIDNAPGPVIKISGEVSYYINGSYSPYILRTTFTEFTLNKISEKWYISKIVEE